MSSAINRRQMLKVAGAAAAGMLASPFLEQACAAEGKPRKVLFFTKSAGFQHDVVKRKSPDELSFAEQFMVEFGPKHGFEVMPTKDGSIFTEKGLEPFDVIMFYTTTDLNTPGTDKTTPMPPDGKQTLLNFIASGKGFLGLHCASDTFHSKGDEVDPYIAMVGGEFVHHGAQQDSRIIAADHNWPPIEGLEDFTKKEEWYILKNLAPDMHVLLVQDTHSMSGKDYHDLPPYPETWARMHEKGRVFYSSMGHREDVWQSDIFAKVLLGGLRWAAGDAKAEVTPNLKEAAPEALSLMRKPGPA